MTIKLTTRQESAGQTLLFDKEVLLLVEGKDDAAFVSMILSTLQLSKSWHVHSMDGIEASWSTVMRLAIDSNEFDLNGKAIGMVLDADSNPAAASDKAKGQFSSAGLQAPQRHSEVASNGLSTSFFVLPDGKSSGALESLVLQGIDLNRKTLAQDYIRLVAESTGATPKNTQKSELQAVLAGHPKAIRTFEVASRMKQFIPPDAEAFGEMRDFLEALDLV